MHPYFEILGRQIPGYALMGVCGFAVCMLLILWSCHRYHFSMDDAAYIFTIALVGTMITAKVLFLLVSLPAVITDWTSGRATLGQLLEVYLRGGMVFYGGLLGGLLGGIGAAAYFGIPRIRCYPILVPVVPLFAGFGRLGCLMAGCCYGRETTSPLHIVFTESVYAPNHIPLIPTQLYEALFDFALCVVLVWLARKESRRPALLRIYLVCYAVFRFILEFYRGDAARGIRLLSTSQWISLGVLAFVLFMTVRYPLGQQVTEN